MKLDEFIGRLIQLTGRRPNVSTGICGSITYGYGRLDNNGYWQFPVYPKRRAW